MAMIFPGMDPYLEDPQIWAGVHQRLIVYVADFLQPLLRPRYVAAVEERVFVEGPDREIIPDVWVRQNRPDAPGPATAVVEADAPVLLQAPSLEIHESYLEILDRQSGKRVVTVLEVLSPTNKYAGPGRKSYLAKQKEVMASQAHLVEIDLLRAGPHVLTVPKRLARQKCDYDYLVCVNRARGLRDLYELYPRKLRERLPRLRVPLAEGDRDVVLDLQAVLVHTYEIGGYEDRLTYDEPCRPLLAPDDQAWANQQIQQARSQS